MELPPIGNNAFITVLFLQKNPCAYRMAVDCITQYHWHGHKSVTNSLEQFARSVHFISTKNLFT